MIPHKESLITWQATFPNIQMTAVSGSSSCYGMLILWLGNSTSCLNIPPVRKQPDPTQPQPLADPSCCGVMPTPRRPTQGRPWLPLISDDVAELGPAPIGSQEPSCVPVCNFDCSSDPLLTCFMWLPTPWVGRQVDTSCVGRSKCSFRGLSKW